MRGSVISRVDGSPGVIESCYSQGAEREETPQRRNVMARGRQLVWITPVHFDHQGRPVDPDYGVDEGVDPGYGIPGGGRPPHVGNRPPGSWGGFPGHPDQGLPGGGWGGRPVDPGYGVEGGGEAGQLPVFPV